MVYASNIWSLKTMFAILVLLSSFAGCVSRPYCPTLTPGSKTVDSTETETVIDVPALVEFDHRTGAQPKQFVQFAQCQVEIELAPSSEEDLPQVQEPAKLISDLRRCLALAVAEKVNVLVFPELALQVPNGERTALLEELEDAAVSADLIIIAGSFYDDNRLACVPIIGPGWVEFGHKFRPSRFESSTVSGKGMVLGPAVPIIHTDCGSYVILTCVDLISDQAQYVARRLATLRKVHVIINNCYNGAALEFLIEANAIARRHPVFVLVTNASSKKDGFGHTSLMANLGDRPYSPRSQDDLLTLLPPQVVQRDEKDGAVQRLLCYDCVVADVGTVPRAMLLYELNLLVPSVPMVTNAPDQGYPPVRDLKIVNLSE